jgi:hypothetical protein
MAYVQAASSNTLLNLSKGRQLERAVIRYQLYVRTDVAARQPSAPAPDAPLPALICSWTVKTYLEREPCFESLSGRLACAEGYTPMLDTQESGSDAMPGEEAKACSLTRTAVAAATSRVAASLAASAAARFDDDLKRRLVPEFARAGVVARPRAR